MHYLDHSATTPVSEAAMAAMVNALREIPGNPSSLHRLGIAAEQALTKARASLAAALGAEKEEILFTSSGSESNNLALFGVARRRAEKGRIILSAGEHPSVENPAAALEAEGYDVVRIPSKGGVLDLAALEDALNEKTLLVSIMMVNNETGAVNPVGKIKPLIEKKAPKALFHIDAVQGFCKIPFQVSALRCDLMTVSGHKIGAPRGIAALYVKKGTTLLPHILGGGQEKGLRSGTENVAGAAALAAAAEEGTKNVRENYRKLCELSETLLTRLRQIPGIHLHRPPAAAPHIVCLSLPGIKSETALHALEDREVYLSAGSACNAKKNSFSRAYVDFGMDRADLESALRVSLSPQNAKDDIDALCEGLIHALSTLK